MLDFSATVRTSHESLSNTNFQSQAIQLSEGREFNESFREKQVDSLQRSISLILMKAEIVNALGEVTRL